MREIRQQEAVDAYLDSRDGRTIINACPRMGKIKISLDIIKEMNITHVLILAPRIDIFKGWKTDIIKFGMTHIVVQYTTFTSLKKLVSPAPWQLVIIDEPHELSRNQQEFLKPIVKMFPTLGLTGTMTQKTRDELYNSLGLDVCYKYTIAQGVEEGILADYQIYIHKIDLRGKEKKDFDKWEYLRDKEKNPLSRHFFDLKLINILQNSSDKMRETRNLIEKFSQDRLLVFCGVTTVADQLGIDVYHSKKKEKEIFDKFCVGNLQYLATIKMMQAGITINPINKGIINYMSGSSEDSAQKICRFLGFEYNNPDKKAEIHIISSTENFESVRLKTGLLFFDNEKIKICA